MQAIGHYRTNISTIRNCRSKIIVIGLPKFISAGIFLLMDIGQWYRDYNATEGSDLSCTDQADQTKINFIL